MLDITRLKAPDLWPPVGLSKNEHEATKLLNASVIALPYIVSAFDAALDLYKFSESEPTAVRRGLTRQWKWISMHESAMQIWFLYEAMDLVTKWFRACPTAKKHFDEEAKERAYALFDSSFPDFKDVRDHVAHAPGSSHTTLKKWLNGDISLGWQMKGAGVFELKMDGKVYTFEVTEGTRQKLVEVLTSFWKAFAPVEKAFDLAGRSDG